MTFRQFLEVVVLPMFPGVDIASNEFRPQRNIQSLVSLVAGANRIRVREDVTQPTFLELSRVQPFSSVEKELIENLVRAFAEIKSEAGPFLAELEDEIVRKAIAKTVAPGRRSQQRVIAKVLTAFSNWATQTYEGERVSSGCIITTSHFTTAKPRLEINSLLKEDFAKGLTDGVDSWWQIAAVGGVRGFESSDNETTLTAEKDGFFPERYRPIVLRTGGNAVGIALNRNGEILVFSKQTLQFAMRRGRWVNFAHDSIVKKMSPGGAGPIELRRAIQASCLDVSFARTGGCIGLLRTRDITEFEHNDVVPPNSRIDSTSNPKVHAAATLVAGRRFDLLPRHVRKELLGLDGALVLYPNGSVYAGGAILNLADVHLGTEGGRSAAAKTLSRYGLGIKVSEDGMISGYKKETGDEVAAFKFG